ncbi:hypothetical protein Tco_0728062 [Tanacetum coccineum]|uniref:Uncharacterized protein n=1 Tax=Tanacetum coccineum TaxID=301880 RepID=A0ABQ4YMF4_9ASTR
MRASAKELYWKIPLCYDDDEDYTIAITPVLPTKEPVNSLSMGDEHLDTIPATELDEVIKSSVEDLVPIPMMPDGKSDRSVDDDPYENIDYSMHHSLPMLRIVSLEEIEPRCWAIITNCATPEKNVKKATNASLILEDFNPPPLYELPCHKEVPGLGILISFSSKNEEKVFNPEILTSKRVHTSLLLELSHRGTKAFKVTKILESTMEIFPCSYQEDI